jgi:hypothetical protein
MCGGGGGSGRPLHAGSMMNLLQNNEKLRFQVQFDGVAYSDRWTAFQRAGDVYITAAGLGVVSKVSLHRSGVCRYAVNDNLASHQPPFLPEDRVISKWRIGSFESVEHTQVLSIQFLPVTYMARTGRHIYGAAHVLPYPPSGGCTEVCVFYSKTNPLLWESSHWVRSNTLGIWKLAESKYVAFRRRIAPLARGRLQQMIQQISRTKRGMVVSEKNPELFSAGSYDCLLSEATSCHCTICCLLAVPNIRPGQRANWSTRTGHKPA